MKGHDVTSRRPKQDARLACRGCRGRGWKRVGSRAALTLSAADDRNRATSKRRCLDCDGSGKE
jgi:muconolactone delta-isomerase